MHNPALTGLHITTNCNGYYWRQGECTAYSKFVIFRAAA
jgi:hypothetical protein